MSNDHSNVSESKMIKAISNDDSKLDAPIESESADKKEEDEDMSEAKIEDNKKKAEKERKKKEELKKKYADWPLKGIKDPHENDVMYGRGGGTNHHSGNKRYRKIVEDRKLEYVNSKRLDKPLVALDIIRFWRAQLPPGRFLKFDEKSGLWNDVGDKKAREKTSQALREKAPLIRKQQEDEKEKGDGKKSNAKISFAAGTKTESSKAEKPVLARDHSLGREYLKDGEAVSVEGFSWRDPFLADTDKRNTAYGVPAAPATPVLPGAYPPAGRHSSSGSLGIAPPHHGGPPPPPPPDYYGRVGSSNQSREFSTGRFDSWSAQFPFPPPPPPPAVHGPTHQRSGSWTHQTPPPQMPHHQRSGSWGGRDHSLAFNPLIGATIMHPADRRTFENRGAPPQQYWASGPYRSPPRQLSPTNSTPSPKPTYNVNIDIARTWSGGAEGNPRPNWGMGQQQQQQQYPDNGQIMQYQSQGFHGANTSPMRNNSVGGFMPKPHLVKRDTSHQNESLETKHSVKRAALNRDNSMASNRLKEQYIPGYFENKFNSDHEVKKLSDNLQQSKLSPKRGQINNIPKPESLKDSNRLTTLDINDLISKPEALTGANRVSTLEALNIDLDNEAMFETSIDGDSSSDIPRPNVMTSDNRLTTNEIFELVNADPEDLVKGDEEPPPLNQESISESWLTQS